MQLSVLIIVAVAVVAELLVALAAHLTADLQEAEHLAVRKANALERALRGW